MLPWLDRLKQGLSQVAQPAINLLMPPECVWCECPVADDQALCAKCAQVFHKCTSYCNRCAFPLPEVVDRSSCIRCRGTDWKFDRVVALGPYRGRLREAILLMKKINFEALAIATGNLLAQRLSEQQINPDVILPVPNHWSRRLAHRTSTAETLATALARCLDKPLVLTSVKRVKRTAKQGMLAWSHRPENVKHAFKVSNAKPFFGRHVLVVDDVFTSGATAAELTRCLLKARAARVTIAVAARGTGSRA